MAEKKIQENPLPDEVPPDTKETMTKTEPLDKPKAAEAPTVKTPTPRWSISQLTSTPPNDLYRRLLPAVLFVLTFVTVMTMLLIYMDTVGLGGQQFRVNMSREYELARIPAASEPLVAYVRQLHFAPPPARRPPAPPTTVPEQVAVMDQLYGEIYNGTFVEVLAGGPRAAGTVFLEARRGWRGAAARAAARDYLALRCCAARAHLGLSPAPHPREVPYREEGFHARVLCVPLLTVLLAADATRADYLLLGGDAALPALTHLPFADVHLKVIEVQSSDPVYREKTTEFLSTKNYTVAAEFPHSVMYALRQ